MKIQIVRLRPNAILPEYQTSGAAAMDFHASIDASVTIHPGKRTVIPTGVAVGLPDGFELQIRARSGLTVNHGMVLANGTGTIDSDYRGEMGVVLYNISDHPFTVEPGMRIAQAVVAQYEKVTWQEVDRLDETVRGKGGYGSTKH